MPPEADYLPSPLIINWSLSFRCNFECSHCYSRLDASEELDCRSLVEIAGRLSKIGVLFVNFGGGEPLLCDELYDVARAASGFGLKVSMNSNGYLLGAGEARALKECGFSSVGISIDSHDPVLHDRFRNRDGSHRRAVEAIGHLHDAGLTATISTVISRMNFSNLEALVDMAAGLGASRLFLHNFKCTGKGLRNRSELDLNPGEWKDFYTRALETARDTPPVPLSFDDPIISAIDETFDSGAVHGSTCGKLSLNIRPNGDITPCGFINLILGNALRDDLLELWEDSPVLARMRNKQPKGKCRTCASYENCLGGCTARAFSLTGDMEQPDPHCWQE